MSERIEKIKKHVKDHQTLYACAATAVGVATFTAIITRGVVSKPISVTVGDAANCTVGVIGKRVIGNSISLISSNRQGPPSWVVRCLETDEVFTSQNKAALAMNLPVDHLSQHLNGGMDHVRGYHFERICMAA